jgi:L-lactate dehydrogenase complex protein LldG
LTPTAGPTEAVLACFVDEATKAGVSVHGPCSNDEALTIVQSIVRDSGGSGVLSWTPEQLGIPDAWLALARLGVKSRCPALPIDKQDRLAVLAEIDTLDVGLTSVVAALADTGTLVMASGEGRPRLAWLLPGHHVALVRRNDVFPDMASFFADRSRVSPDQVAHLAFITGPSRTADIELTLTRGVHGPKAVHVILLD